jgi:hypothetical protein
MKTTRVKAKQAHPVPNKVTNPTGPFPRELFKESKIVDDYQPALNEDGMDFEKGATAQNNFKPLNLYCGDCNSKVLSTKTHEHEC